MLSHGSGVWLEPEPWRGQLARYQRLFLLRATHARSIVVDVRSSSPRVTGASHRAGLHRPRARLAKGLSAAPPRVRGSLAPALPSPPLSTYASKPRSTRM